MSLLCNELMCVNFRKITFHKVTDRFSGPNQVTLKRSDCTNELNIPKTITNPVRPQVIVDGKVKCFNCEHIYRHTAKLSQIKKSDTLQ